MHIYVFNLNWFMLGSQFCFMWLLTSFCLLRWSMFSLRMYFTMLPIDCCLTPFLLPFLYIHIQICVTLSLILHAHSLFKCSVRVHDLFVSTVMPTSLLWQLQLFVHVHFLFMPIAIWQMHAVAYMSIIRSMLLACLFFICAYCYCFSHVYSSLRLSFTCMSVYRHTPIFISQHTCCFV